MVSNTWLAGRYDRQLKQFRRGLIDLLAEYLGGSEFDLSLDTKVILANVRKMIDEYHPDFVDEILYKFRCIQGTKDLLYRQSVAYLDSLK